MMSNAKVFITQMPVRLEDGAWVPTMNLNPAKEFGELFFMLPPGINHPSSTEAVELLKERLNGFDPEKDSFLPLGDPMLMVAAGAIIGARHPRFQMLRWDRHERRYFPHEIFT